MCCTSVFAQRFAVKTNLLYDLTTTANLGVEVGLAPKWSFDLSGNVNAWNVSDMRMRQWSVQPEARYWLCERFNGHFFGLHALGGQLNFGNLKWNIPFFGFDDLKDTRHQGWFVGAGIAYGYSWILSRHWNIEAELGVGWIMSNTDVYPCAECGTAIEKGKKQNYFGPTKLAVNLEYIF